MNIRPLLLILSLACAFSCTKEEVRWVDFTSASQASKDFFNVYMQKVDNLSEDGIPADCYLPGGVPFSEYEDDSETKATTISPNVFFQKLIGANSGGRVTELAGTYRSIDTNGDEIMLSGKVILPSDGKFERYMLVSHYTVGSNVEAPSNCFSIEGVFATMGYCVIVPDYLGYGVTSHLVHPYLAMDLTARNALDMYLAVKPFLEACGVAPEYDDIIVMGFSQGGANTMAVQRLIETSYKDEIGIRRVFAGGGPYDVTATYDSFVTTNHAAYPCAVPLVVQGMQVGAGLSLTMESFATPLVYENLDEWFNSKRYTTREMNELLGTHTTSDLISPAGLDRTSYEVAELYMAMNANSIIKTGWTPKAPVYMLHSMDDDTVDFINAMHAKSTWEDANIVYNFGHYGNHTKCYLRFISTISTILTEEKLSK